MKNTTMLEFLTFMASELRMDARITASERMLEVIDYIDELEKICDSFAGSAQARMSSDVQNSIDILKALLGEE